MKLDDEQRSRLERLKSGYRMMAERPEEAVPKIIVNVPPSRWPRWEEQLADPLVMLDAQFAQIERHLELEDDFVPALRVNFGTAQVAHAFGCEMALLENNLPAAGSHVLQNPEEIQSLEIPSMDAGWFPKLREWSRIWLDQLPEGIELQHPDIQSPFNTAHLIRGNGIFTDFFDAPEQVGLLLEKVTDFMIALMGELKSCRTDGDGWFCDWGAYWKGHARISNCTSDMLGPELYNEYVLPHDLRFFEAVGGGRIHCCGGAPGVIDNLVANPLISGMDFDSGLHDPGHVCQLAAPETVLVLQEYGKAYPYTERLLAGDWPEKRNVVLITEAPTLDAGRELLGKLRASIP